MFLNPLIIGCNLVSIMAATLAHPDTDMREEGNAKTRVLVIGGGAVGTMVSYALETGGRTEVTAVLRSNFQVVQQSGFSIDSVDHGHKIKGWRPSVILNAVPSARSLPATQDYNYVVVTTKNIPDVRPTVAELIEPAVTPEKTIIVLIQNGLNIERPIRERFPDNTILSGIQMIGANETSPGVILHNEPDVCKLGVFTSSTSGPSEHEMAQAHLFIDLYNACGKVKCQYDPVVQESRWRKLVYNSSYNSVSAALNLNVTQMRLSEHIIDDLVKPIMQEIVNIASAAGHQLPESVIMDMITIDSLDSWCMPSMGQDVMRGTLIEFENIVGEPLRTAQRLGVPCPTLTTINGILKGIQTRTKLARGLTRIDVKQGGKYSGR